MKRERKKPGKSTKKSRERALQEEIVNPDAGGIDVGAQELVVAVAKGRDERPVRTFDSFTSSLFELRDWLLKCGVKTVAMESTGNYWIGIYSILEEAGIKVWLVNARHVKGVPGKKTDVCDAQWLQQLHTSGLLAKSFRPAREIAPIRYVMRHRGQLVESAGRHLLLMQKVLTEMNLKLQHVLSDIDGVSARAIIEAILSGERDPAALAALCDRRCRSPREKVIAALQGDYRQEYLLVLAQCYKAWKRIQEDLAELDAELKLMIGRVAQPSQESLPEGKKGQHMMHKNSPAFDVYEQAWRFYGVDLSSIDGISAGTIATLMTELGTGLQIRAAFPSAKAFCSWLGLCPDNRISGGKVLKAKTRPVSNRVSTAFRLAAQALSHNKQQLGDYCRRMKARLGKAEGITATAHKLARIVFSMIATRQPFDDSKVFELSPLRRTRRLRNLNKIAEKLGFTLVPSPLKTS
jgi:transposase